MEYFVVFAVVFAVVALRAFQQKVVAANQYPVMGIVGGCIYACEGTAIILVSHGGYSHVIPGALGAGLGCITAVYVYNRYFTTMFKKEVV